VSDPVETPEAARTRLETEALTPNERVRLWERIEASHVARPRRRRAWIAGLALAGAGLAVVLFAVRKEHRPEAPPFASACHVDPNQGELRVGLGCEAQTVEVSGDEWLLRPGTAVARLPDGPKVEEGGVRFRVRHREKSPFRVRVSHGEVRVIGTVFTIEQHAGKGSVSVSEGVIEFVWNDGARERVAAGQTLHWPRPVEPTKALPLPTASVAGGTPDAGARPAASAASDMDQVMERLLQLRSQRRYAEAASLLRKTMSAGGLSPVQQERLSYELGLALEASGGGACAHWKNHAKRFGTKRHSAALAKRLERCEAE
jgi:FecR-like protein